MKLSEYIKEFGDKQVDVDKLSEFITEDKVFVPRRNEKYYFISGNGAVNYNYNNHEADKSVINYQQVYRTRVEAEFARDKAIFLEFMRKEFLRNSDVIDWQDKDQAKYYMFWNCLDRDIIINFYFVIIIRNDFYTTNKNWLNEFTNKHKDNIKKYYFEVNDDE